MGSHGVAGARLRAGKTRPQTEGPPAPPRIPRPRTLRDWPVSWRLVALIVLALVMGLVFGGLRVAAAADSAAQFGRVSQLASLGQHVTGLVQALQDERDETTGVSSGGNPATLAPWYRATDTAAARVRTLAAGVDGSFPANIQASVATVLSEIGHLGELRKTAQASQDALAVIANYAAPMFVYLSRRSQSLIERLARMIDSLEQNEADPSRLSNLFSMDHLVTRMRRNSENLLLLAGHETARKWSAPVPLADVVRAAASEIELYGRVAMKIQPGISVTGPAVSDIVHLLAEIIENATIFSPRDTPVHISGQEIPSGGVLIEVSDSGVGVPEARLTEMNIRLDDPPVIDVSVSRHMGLFAVARLAERHGVRVRLRAGSPRGLVALVWLPDSITEHGTVPSPWSGGRPGRLAASQSSNGWSAAVPVPVSAPAPEPAPTPALAPAAAVPREPGPAPDPSMPDWFRSPQAPAAGHGESPGAGAGWRAGADEWAESRHAAQIVAEPVHGDQTAAGLPVRIPRANLIAGSAGGHRAGGTSSRPGDGHGPQTAQAARAPRSAELARRRLSGFQRGTRRAKGQTPRAGEGADR